MLVGHAVDPAACSPYPAITMRRQTSVRALLTAILVIAGMGMLHTVSPAVISGQASGPDGQREAVDDIRLAVKLEQSVNDVLPGEQIEYAATIENRTRKRQANLSVQMIVGGGRDAVAYVPNSTFVRRSEDHAFVSLGSPLSKRPTNIIETLASEQVVSIKWRMQINECTQRNRWLQVGIAARTDETELALAEVQAYIAPHADIMATRHFSATHDVYPANPAPGEAVRHTIRIVNDGYVVLDDWLVQVSDTDSSIFPLVAEDASFYIISERGGAPARVVATDGRWWGHPQGGFSLDYLNPGNVLVLQWTEYVGPDVPIWTAIHRLFSVETGSWATSWLIGDGFMVSPARNDLSVEIETADPGYLESTYEAGDLIRMRIVITNRTATAHDDVRVTLGLPSAVSYVNGSGAYATPRFKAGNSRRLPENWINDGAALPTIEPGDTTTITFKVKVGDSVSPQENLDVYATLRSPDNPDIYAGTQIDVAQEPGIDITLRDEEPVDPGGQVTFNITVRNSGQVPLVGAKFGVEETCSGIDYVPGTLWIESGESVWRDDAVMLQQQAQGDDISIPLGDGDLDPGETVRIDMTFQVAGDLKPGTVAGPQFIVTAESPDTVLVPWDLGVSRTEIVVAEPDESFVTAEELEAARDEILIEVRDVARDTKDLAEDIRETGDETAELVTQTGKLANDIKANTEAIEGQADAIFNEVTEANPWSLGWKWVLLWGGFGALASLIAGFAVWFVLPPTLMHALAWLRERRRKNPFLAAHQPAPLAQRSPSQWRATAVQASEPLVGALRRIRDWVGGLRRR